MKGKDRTVIAAIAAMLLATPVEARRSALSDEPEVELVADLPDNAKVEAYGADGATLKLDLGYSYRELSAFWMPFWAYEDQGIVFFSRGADGRPVLAEATARELASIRERMGRDYVSEYRFNRIKHMWGWLAVLALIGLFVLQHRRERRRRDADGLI